jgi:hypothetical protein
MKHAMSKKCIATKLPPYETTMLDLRGNLCAQKNPARIANDARRFYFVRPEVPI